MVTVLAVGVSVSASVLKHRQQAQKALCTTDAEQALTYGTKRCRGGFTSFCKNEGTDLLIFFRCSGSENKDEEGDEMDETKESVDWEAEDTES